MANLSKERRDKMLSFINKLKDEHKSDDDCLIALGEIESALTAKKYGLVWEEHEEEVDKKMVDNIPVFIEDETKEIISNENEKFNFLLEGDNLHSLYLLEKTHKGKIDLIYIDPPYNTGNKDFIYDDTFVDEEDSFRHSKWLSFMAEILKIARRLLTEEGVVFIQINDIEVAQLKLLCDDIFGEYNFLNLISIKMKNIAGASGGGQDKKFKKNCEYILIYTKNYDMFPLLNNVYEYKEISELVEEYRKNHVSWKYTSVLIDDGEKEYVASTVDGDGNEIKIFNRKNYLIKSIGQIMREEHLTEKEVYYKYGNNIFMTAMPQSSIRPRVMNKLQELGLSLDFYSIEYIPKTGKNKGRLYEQFYKGEKSRLLAWLHDVSEEKDGVLYKKDLQGTYWDLTPYINNLTKEGDVEFNNGKKPVELLKRIIGMFPQKDITVLDFFAGSGSTGHALLQLNKEDGGSRKFILCTNNDNNICNDITLPRLKNVIFGSEHTQTTPANLKYYKTGFVSKKEELLSDALLDHIKEMVQLEHMTKIDGKNYILLLDDDSADNLEKHWDEYSNLKGIYISKNVLLTSSQDKLFNTVEMKVIPDYYFNFELKEAGESW